MAGKVGAGGLGWRVFRIGGVIMLLGGGVFAFSGDRVLAQITPDATLGTEGSVVTPNATVDGFAADLIEGGAARGANLFHSFQEFNVEDGQRVYFANPVGIENILGRVTGNQLSNILGTLGVNGNANLFFLNPNGVIFGPNAQLDVAGSFVVSTANSFGFENGWAFSATNPEAPPLLTLNVTPGLQYGSNHSGVIANAGNLAVGQNLTLAAGNLDLQGQLYALGDLTLQAQDTVRVRDSATTPFVASAGGQLLVQGDQAVDIFALNHPDSGFFSGGDLVLRSANTVSGDAHYWSGGNFRVERLDGSLGDLFSPYDPVVRANGDVAFASYTGASLHIFAGGLVFIPGTILITAPETGSAGTDFINETVTLSDGSSLAIDGSAYLTLDIRAGTIAFGNPFVNTGTPTSADIIIGGIFTDVIFGNGGRVFLTNQYQPNPVLSGEIIVGAIDTSDVLGGGSVVIDSRSGITLIGELNVLALDLSLFGLPTLGNGGQVTLLAGGDITLNPGSIIDTSGEGGGSIHIQGTQLLLEEALVFSNTAGTGDGGDIYIQATGAVVLDNGGIVTGNAPQSTGSAGNITIEAEQLTVSGDDLGVISTSTLGEGRGGDLTVETVQLALRDGGQLTVETRSTGDAGNLTVRATESVEVSGTATDGETGSALSTDSRSTDNPDAGNAGDLSITTRQLIVGDGARVSAATSGAGQGGDLTIFAPDSVQLSGGNLITRTEGSGDAGDLTITTGQLVVRDGEATAFTFGGQGRGGDIVVTASDFVELIGTGGIGSGAVFSSGDAGSVTIQTERLIIRDGASVATSSIGLGQGGDLNVTAFESVEVIGESFLPSRLTTSTGSIADNSAGDLTITTGRLIIRDGAEVTTRTLGENSGGRLVVNASESVEVSGTSATGQATELSAETIDGGDAGELRIVTPRLSVQDGAQVLASTSGTGTAGSIVVQNADSILLSNNGSISTAVDADAVVNASTADQGGNIDLQTRLLSLTNGAEVTASTSGQGDAGNILVRDAQEVLLSNSSISTAVNTDAIGQGGNIEIQTGFLSLDSNAQLSASTTGQGDTGRVAVEAVEAIALAQGSQISSAVEAGATGNSQQITLQTPTLSLTGDSQISAATSSTGNAGSILVQNADSVSLDGSSISTAVNEGAVAQQPSNIDIQTRSLSLTNGAQVTASTAGQGDAGSIFVRGAEEVSLSDSAISTESSSAGIAGDVTLNTQQLTLQDDSEVSASTVSSQGGDINLQGLNSLQVRNSLISASTETGTAGAVTVNATDSVQLSGAGGLSVEATTGGTAGNLSIETEQLTVQDGARVTVSSPSGQAGDLTISADSLRLNQGRLFAETGTSSAEGGANITLQGLDFLLLDDESLISATAFDQANGGNVTIDSTFIVATPSEGPEGSDIIANAVEGNGGRVSVTTQGIFGIQFRPERTPDNDITVSSDFGVAGEFALTQPDIDPSRGLTALPTNLVDPTSLVDRSCAPGGAARTGSFTVTGRGGLPPSPTEPLDNETFLTDFGTLDAEEQDNAPPDAPPPSSATPQQIVEAQGWVKTPDGQVILTAQAPTATPQSPWLTSPSCQNSPNTPIDESP